MKKRKKKQKKLSRKEKQTVWATFTLLFPSLLISLCLMFERTIALSVIVILLFFYQATLLKNFVEGHYTTE